MSTGSLRQLGKLHKTTEIGGGMTAGSPEVSPKKPPPCGADSENVRGRYYRYSPVESESLELSWTAFGVAEVAGGAPSMASSTL